MNKNNFAVTPPMGWNSYDYYNTSVTEDQVRANADYMAKHLKSFGWEYVVVDIEWYSNDAGTRPEFQYIPFGDDEMDAYGRLIPSPNRFPSSAGGKGFGPLADYVHSLGLKFGIHIMRGIPRVAAQNHCPVLGTDTTADMVADPSSVCLWNPDMYGVRATDAGQAYYDSIISMYAEWGVDFIKCDDICDSRLYRGDNLFSGWEETRMIHRAIQKTNRAIVLSLSPGPAHIDRAWEYCRYANMWRITDDFWDDWKLLKEMFWRCETWQDHVRKGCFPDCDMLPVGKIGGGFGAERTTNFTTDELRTMMTLWCIFRSPLMIGADLTQMDDDTLALLTNTDLLALLSKDCGGRQVYRKDDSAVWCSRNSATGELYVALFNLSDAQAEISVEDTAVAEALGVDPDAIPKTRLFYDIWEKTTEEQTGSSIRAAAAPHGVKLFRIAAK
jgi:hypothetical protein